jgi:hypothetical protein
MRQRIANNPNSCRRMGPSASTGLPAHVSPLCAFEIFEALDPFHRWKSDDNIKEACVHAILPRDEALSVSAHATLMLWSLQR